jgi:hypothetical protein
MFLILFGILSLGRRSERSAVAELSAIAHEKGRRFEVRQERARAQYEAAHAAQAKSPAEQAHTGSNQPSHL